MKTSVEYPDAFGLKKKCSACESIVIEDTCHTSGCLWAQTKCSACESMDSIENCFKSGCATWRRGTCNVGSYARDPLDPTCGSIKNKRICVNIRCGWHEENCSDCVSIDSKDNCRESGCNWTPGTCSALLQKRI